MHKTHIVRGLAVAVLVGALGGYQTRDISAAPETMEQEQKPAAGLSLGSRASKCAVPAISAEQLALIDEAAERSTNRDKNGVVTIPVYWHVITTVAGGGNVSALIPDQMLVLRDAFAGSRFAFTVKAVEVIANEAWFFAAAGSPDEIAMKTALRKGGPESLNIYTTNGDVYLGWATLPADYKFAPSYDGVVLWWAALPGTGLEGESPEEPDGILTYDQGDTGTHEVGHWLGLEHTFGPGDGSCSKPGDFIKDTPTEAIPQFFCAPRDSCVGKKFPGEDPITNFMDYVDDVCMDNFTSDQTSRMRKHWHAFRDKKPRN